MLENEFYLTGFKDTKQYVKLLAELDLLNDAASLDLGNRFYIRSLIKYPSHLSKCHIYIIFSLTLKFMCSFSSYSIVKGESIYIF